MILVDTSVWIEFFRRGDKLLEGFLEAGEVLTHPFVIGELAIGQLKSRDRILNELGELPRATTATDPEVLHFIDDNGLAGSGIGYIDAHLLASAKLTPETIVWSRDRKLSEVAQELRLGTVWDHRPS